MGFIHIDGSGKRIGKPQLLMTGINMELYNHLQDFIERIRPGIEQLNILIRIGAFRFTGKNKKRIVVGSQLSAKEKQQAYCLQVYF